MHILMHMHIVFVLHTYIKIGVLLQKWVIQKKILEISRYSFLMLVDVFMDFKFWLRFGRNSKLQYVSLFKQKSSQFYRNIYKH